MVLDSVTDPPVVIAAVEALKPKIEIVPVVPSHEYTIEPSGLNSRTFTSSVVEVVNVVLASALPRSIAVS